MPDKDNPYRQTENTEGQSAPDFADLYHPEAHGLTGEMLDAILRAAFTEGYQRGFQEGVESVDTARRSVADPKEAP